MTDPKTITIAALQMDVLWESVDENLQYIGQKLSGIEADVVVLPEMCLTGFSMSPEKIALDPDGSEIAAMQTLATERGQALVFSAAVKDGQGYYNRLFFMEPSGVVHHYDKRHLFRFGGEHEHYQGGAHKLIVEYKGFRICPLICYDLRFGVYSRNVDNGYDVLIYIASWPEARSYAWDTLLRARAIENLAYCVGVNRVGSDPKNGYCGGTVILDHLGKEMALAPLSQEAVISAELSKDTLQAFRDGFGAHRDADKFSIEL